jgi:hypothetical protein
VIDELTPPERFTERAGARRRRQSILPNPCAHCVHRDRQSLAWGRAVCAVNHARAFPLCMKDGQAPSFEMDDSGGGR